MIKAPDAAWKHDMFSGDQAMANARASAIETGTKLYISNLDYGVSNEDIKVNLFHQCIKFVTLYICGFSDELVILTQCESYKFVYLWIF